MRRLFLALVLLVPLSASAATVDFSTPMTDLDGNAIPTSQTDKTPVTLGVVADTALLNTYQDEQSITGEEKVHRFDLAVLVKTGEVDLTAENVALIKRLIAKAYAPLVVGRAWAILDPQAAQEPKK